MTIGCNIWMICLKLNRFFYGLSRILHLPEFEWILRSSVWVVFNNFLLIDATDRSKISSDQKRFFSSYNPVFGHFYYMKVVFDNYRYNAISIGRISDWIKVSCSQARGIKINLRDDRKCYNLGSNAPTEKFESV